MTQRSGLAFTIFWSSYFVALVVVALAVLNV